MTSGRFLQLFGAAFLLAVILMHVFEALHIFPAMGWGLPNSAGHYLDLASAIFAVTLLPLGFAFDAWMRRKTPRKFQRSRYR
jgi:pilus assembly protein TadC